MIILKINARFNKQSKKAECDYATYTTYFSKHPYLFLNKSSYIRFMIE